MDSTKKIHLQGELQEDPTTKMARTVRPFKRSATEEPMTAQSGLVPHREFLRGLGFLAGWNRKCPGRAANGVMLMLPHARPGMGYTVKCMVRGLSHIATQEHDHEPLDGNHGRYTAHR